MKPVWLAATGAAALAGSVLGGSAAAGPGGGAVTLGQCQGTPTLLVGGKPAFPLFHFSQEVLDDYARRFHAAGFRFYGCIEERSFLDLGWTGDDQFDFTKLDKVLSGFKRRLPDSYVLPKVHVWAPEWWVARHPQEQVGLLLPPESSEYVIGSGPRHESFASLLWRAEAGEGLRRLVRHVLQADYADRVLGIMVAGGTFGEWHPWASENLPDTSEPMRHAFIRYARERYGGDEGALRRAWGDPRVTFETLTIPDRAARQTPDLGLFRDPARSRRVVDYYDCFHQVTVEAIDYFCRIVKEESKGRLLTCVDYAYEPDMPYLPQEVHHRAPAQALRLPSVDMFSAPHSYWHRGLGEHGALRHFPQSVIAHGKLFIDEADERTHLAAPQLFRRASNLDESRQVLSRSFMNVVTEGVGMWFMDHSSGAWYADPVFFEDFANYQRWGEFSMSLARGSAAEVATITASRSEFYLAAAGDVSAQFHVAQVEQLRRSGAPFDRYLIEDLADGLVPSRRVYVFLDAAYLTPDQRAAVERLKGGGRTLVWFFAPGFVTDRGLSMRAMEELTGIHFRCRSRPFGAVRLDRSLFPDAPETFEAWREGFGPVRQLAPRFVPDDPGAAVWGRYADTAEPALVVKSLGTWRSVYCPTANLPWPVINRLYREAGVHLYCESGDNLAASRSWVGLHAVSAGDKTIRLRQPSPVYDVLSNRLVGRNLSEFTVPLRAHETALFVLADPGR
jgi:hypothetical protein